MKKLLKKLVKGERGQALPMVLIMMVVSGLILAPLLSYTSAGLKVGKAYEKMADEFYAADAGIEDGLWQIKYNHLEDLFGNYEKYNYDAEYNYPGGYNVDVNDIEVDVTIENIWIPLGINAPSNEEAEQLIKATTEDGIPRLIVTGGVSAELTQQVKIYYGKEDSDLPLLVNEIGVWLPPGFSYDEDGECTLETWFDADEYTRSITPHCGGYAVIWEFPDPIPFTDLPGVNPLDTPMTCTFTFNFNSGQTERSPEAVAWITTNGASGIPSFTWDADVRVFHITSTAAAGDEDGTTIDAYAIKTELRELGSAISGDYVATGNTLMLDNHYDWGAPELDTLLPYSNAIVSEIPDNAHVDKALLYWSAWTLPGTHQTILFEDECYDIDGNWDAGSDWGEYSSSQHGDFFGAHQDSGDRELELIDSRDLSTYHGEDVVLSLNYWRQGNLENSDRLYYALYRQSGGWSTWYEVFRGDGSGGATTHPRPYEHLIPEQYVTNDFRIKFKIEGFTQGSGGNEERCYIDNIEIVVESEIIADTEVTFEIDGHQLYFADDEYGNPTVPAEGYQSLYAGEWQVLENQTNEYSYSCKKDVTELVQLAEDLGYADHGNATYTVGDVDADTDDEWSYAAWSLILIYSSPDTKGHQLYLYDDFIYVDNDESLEYPISGFLVPDPIPGEEEAARITCFVGEGDDYYANDYIALNPPYFPHAPDSYKLWDHTLSTEHPGSNTESHPNNVWNSKSIGLEETGIDIDTFSVRWDSDLLEPGDTSALVTLETDTDSWNLVYIILSFRSSTVTGGTITYLVEG